LSRILWGYWGMVCRQIIDVYSLGGILNENLLTKTVFLADNRINTTGPLTMQMEN
jgi:hypothetical protein